MSKKQIEKALPKGVTLEPRVMNHIHALVHTYSEYMRDVNVINDLLIWDAADRVQILPDDKKRVKIAHASAEFKLETSKDLVNAETRKAADFVFREIPVFRLRTQIPSAEFNITDIYNKYKTQHDEFLQSELAFWFGIYKRAFQNTSAGDSILRIAVKQHGKPADESDAAFMYSVGDARRQIKSLCRELKINPENMFREFRDATSYTLTHAEKQAYAIKIANEMMPYSARINSRPDSVDKVFTEYSVKRFTQLKGMFEFVTGWSFEQWVQDNLEKGK